MSIMNCPHCGAPAQESLFCRDCSRYMPDSTGRLEKVTFNRRFWGDALLESILIAVTLVIGWLIWLYFTAQKSQTPAKSLLNVYTLDVDTGQPISAGRVWVRDVVVEILLIGFVNVFVGIAGLVDAAFVLFDKNRRSVHDHVMNTIVVYAPSGLPETLAPAAASITAAHTTSGNVADEMRELARLHEEGILTDDEYEAKRKALADKL